MLILIVIFRKFITLTTCTFSAHKKYLHNIIAQFCPRKRAENPTKSFRALLEAWLLTLPFLFATNILREHEHYGSRVRANRTLRESGRLSKGISNSELLTTK
jgi:hypothetical protein